ncbi:MAG: hypothetical protein QM504_06630 [Pseudomonadota bacterium]
MIEFNVFASDLLAKATFQNTEKYDDDLEKWNNPKITILASSELRDLIYSKSQNNDSDYFWYKGHQFAFTSDRHLACYTDKSILLNVYGYGGEELVVELENETRNALCSWNMIQKEVDKGFVSLPIDWDDVLHHVSTGLLRKLFEQYKRTVAHVLLDEPVFDVLYSDLIIDTGLYGLAANEYDYSPESFFKHFNLNNIWGMLKKQFDPAVINAEFYKSKAYYVANEFGSVKKLAKGYKFRIDNYWSNDISLGTSFVESLLASFKCANNETAVEEMKCIFDCKLVAGDKEKTQGLDIRVFQKHYTVLVGHEYFKDVLLFVNKFATDTLSSALDGNDDLGMAA